MDAEGLRLAIRGRSSRPRRSDSTSDMDEDDDNEDMCMRPLSCGCGRVGTGEASCIFNSKAMECIVCDGHGQKVESTISSLKGWSQLTFE